MCAAFLVVLLCVLVVSSRVSDSSPEHPVTVTSPVGPIQGLYETVNDGVWRYSYTKFLGIPFAQPPSGDRRFSRPVKKDPFTSTYVANSSLNVCPNCWKTYVGTENIGEDCLNLDVFVPGNATSAHARAVMIWIYGGAFQVGSKNTYKATAFVGLNDVVLVTVNYRVSAFGFLANGKELRGNYGLWDQHLAIQWVHDNIASFGGDPSRVTVAGQSAGAASVIYQAMYSGNKGLFSRVIAESGSPNSVFALDYHPQRTYDTFLATTPCNGFTGQAAIDCLRALDLKDIVGKGDRRTNFLPVVDGDFIPAAPKELFVNVSFVNPPSSMQLFGGVDLLLGFNSNEGVNSASGMGNTTNFTEGFSKQEFQHYLSLTYALFNTTPTSLAEAAVTYLYTDWSDPDNKLRRMNMAFDLQSDFVFRTPALQAAIVHDTLNGTGQTYTYVFDHKPSYSLSASWVRGANHGEEMGFVLGFPDSLLTYYNVTISAITARERSLSTALMKYWTNFVKTGSPNDLDDNDPQRWPTFQENTQESIVFQTNVTSFPVVDHIRAIYVRFWNYLFPELQEEPRSSCSD